MSDTYDWIAAAAQTDREVVKRVLLAYGYSAPRTHRPVKINKDPGESRGSVVMPWVSVLSFRQQAVVLSALRGCDGKPKEDASKKITRKFRGNILLPADPDDNADGSFMRQDEVDFVYIDCWVKDLDHYPVHWLMHFAHACEITGYCCPDENVARFWWYVYTAITNALHVGIELAGDMQHRLRDKQK